METIWREMQQLHAQSLCAPIDSHSGMKVTSRCLSHLRLDQTYCLLNARSVSVVLELFKAIDIRGEMALDGKAMQLHAL